MGRGAGSPLPAGWTSVEWRFSPPEAPAPKMKTVDIPRRLYLLRGANRDRHSPGTVAADGQEIQREQPREALAGAGSAKGAKPKILFDVRSFSELTSEPTYSDWAVESSTRGGISIRKRRQLVFDPGLQNAGGKPCAIVAIRPAE
jgi:hypothetical protein